MEKSIFFTLYSLYFILFSTSSYLSLPIIFSRSILERIFPFFISCMSFVISFFVNINHSAVFVTTHSPYILTAANTLYFAGQVMEDQPGLQREIGAIIGRKREIHPGAFTAFKINPNKEVENLVNQTLGELSTELIDDISDEINENYLKIFDYAARLQPRERKETGDKNAE